MADASPDPDFPDLDRLIARTVPRSPHADRPELAEPPAPDTSDAASPPTTPTDPHAASLDDPPAARTDPDSAPPGADPEPDLPGPGEAESGPGEVESDAGEVEIEGVQELGEELESDAAFEAALEALLLVVDAPVDEAALGTALGQPASRVRAALPRMAGAYTADGRGIDLRRSGEGWRFYTRETYAPYVERMLLDGQRARLTRAALETLAVVAYRQPVTRARVSAVRGVNCDGVLRTLLTRGLVEEAGTDEHTQGTLFRTTELFLERLGLSSVQELPPLAPLLPDIDAIDDM